MYRYLGRDSAYRKADGSGNVNASYAAAIRDALLTPIRTLSGPILVPLVHPTHDQFDHRQCSLPPSLSRRLSSIASLPERSLENTLTKYRVSSSILHPSLFMVSGVYVLKFVSLNFTDNQRSFPNGRPRSHSIFDVVLPGPGSALWK